MTALHLVYLASIAGAVLFFIAGAATMWSRGGRGAQPHEAELRHALATSEAFAHQQQAHLVELERELARTRSTAATHAQRTSAEVERASAEVERVGAELERARAETVSLRARLELASQQFAHEAGTKEITRLRDQPARGARPGTSERPQQRAASPDVNGRPHQRAASPDASGRPQQRGPRSDTNGRELLRRAERAELQVQEMQIRAERAAAQVRELAARAERADAHLRELATRAERAEAELRAHGERAVRPPAGAREHEMRAREALAAARELETRASAAEAELAAARAAARELESRARSTDAELSALRASVRELESRASSAEAELAAARALADASGTDVRELHTRAERAERDLAAATTQAQRLAQELERTRTELTAAAGELEHVTARATELERQLGDRTQSVRDFATENEQLKGRLRDAEGLRAEYVRLRTATVESEYLKSEIARLEQEVRTLRADALGGARPPARTRSARTTSQEPGGHPAAPGASPPPGTISDSLLRVLDRFAESGTRSLAISDSIGFPLASTGNDALALAAYAALIAEAAARANQFLPVARTISIDILDERGTRVSVWPFEIEGDRLFLANLAVAPVDGARVESTLAELSAILAPSAIAS